MAGKPVHLEIPAKNTSRAQEFYKDLFGWEFQAMEGPVEYHMARISDDAGSAVFPSDTRAIRVYFDVDDINAGASSLKELGGKADHPQPFPAWAGSSPELIRKGIRSDSGKRTRRRRWPRPGSNKAGSDRPGVAGAEQAREVAFALLSCGIELLCHELVVDRALDVPENADRGRTRRATREPAERERRARLGMVCVVHQKL